MGFEPESVKLLRPWPQPFPADTRYVNIYKHNEMTSLFGADFRSDVTVSICKPEISAHAVNGGSSKELFQILGLRCHEIISLD